jgi:hypothetical protein
MMMLPIAALVGLFLSPRQHTVRVPDPPPAVVEPTFDGQIVRLFQAHCQSCHHAGDIAPFSLTNYEEARDHAALIKLKTAAHEMPPWKPVNGCGTFADAQSRTLTQGEIDLIAKWVENGAPRGNAVDLPQPLDFGSGWTLGTPDLALSYPEAFMPPNGHDEYRCFTMPTNITADSYVSAIDVHPGSRKEVHHVIAFLDSSGESQKLDDADPAPGYRCFGGPGFSLPSVLGGWVPGARPYMLPEDVGYELPASARVVLQVHYHVHGFEPEADRTQIGIYFQKKKPAKLMTIVPLINQTFTIPALTNHYKVTAKFPIGLPFGTHLWFIAPHMHLLGRTMNVVATYADGKTECLVNIDNWDFNWQGMYRYSQPMVMPAGTRFSLEAFYDNPGTTSVSWGEETTDEMCIAFLGFTVD